MASQRALSSVILKTVTVAGLSKPSRITPEPISPKPTKSPEAAKSPKPIVGKTPPPELRLLQCKRDIEEPKVLHFAHASGIGGLIKGIVFDMDGTLTLPGNMDFAALRRQLGIPTGEDILAWVETLPADEAEEAKLLIQDFEERAFLDVELQPDLFDGIRWLREQGLEVALCTRNNSVCVQRFLEAAHFPATMFDPIITRDHDFCKPDPRTLDIVFQQWNLSPNNVMMVGDDVKDLLTGFGAGCWTCLMMGEQNQKFAERDDCDFVITHLDSLRRFVQTQSTFEQESGYKSANATPLKTRPMRVDDLKDEFSNVETK